MRTTPVSMKVIARPASGPKSAASPSQPIQAVTGDILLPASVVSVGNGLFKVVPQAPRSEVTAAQAAKALCLSRSTVYRLCQERVLECRKPSRGRVLISVASLQKHRDGCADPEYWDKRR